MGVPAPRQQCSHRVHRLAGSIVLWMHRPPAKPEAFEAKEAQEAATEVLASASKTLLQARQAGVPVPVLRLRLMQVRLFIAGPCLYPRGALRRQQNHALLTPLRAGPRTGASNNRRSSASSPQTQLRGGRREDCFHRAPTQTWLGRRRTLLPCLLPPRLWSSPLQDTTTLCASGRCVHTRFDLPRTAVAPARLTCTLFYLLRPQVASATARCSTRTAR